MTTSYLPTATTLEEIIFEFGGLAHWHVVNRHGRFDQEKWDNAMLLLYDRRDALEGIEGRQERGAVALSAFAVNDQSAERLKRKLAARAI